MKFCMCITASEFSSLLLEMSKKRFKITKLRSAETRDFDSKLWCDSPKVKLLTVIVQNSSIA